DDRVSGKLCDNISGKNISFCELTAVYWAWKNLLAVRSQTAYVGVSHYRRFFEIAKKRSIGDVAVRPYSEVSDYAIDFDVLNACFRRHDIISARKMHARFSILQQYCELHVCEDIYTLICVMHELYPECDRAVCDALLRSNSFSPYNMFIMPWSLFDEYCEWLFSILFEVERRIDITNYNRLQRRVFGYMGERLFNVWVCWKKLREQELPVLLYDDNAIQKSQPKEMARYLVRDLKYSLFRETVTGSDKWHHFITDVRPKLC
ncbi:MAG: DUF4422 domain-containing protein, partial [Eggerthellaceae bacterium]|nr:DUF4422 domain-containing protein [Eggerthellaceae bacterium]